MVVLAGDMNGHVGSNCVGYDGTHGGYGFGDRDADGSRILDGGSVSVSSGTGSPR